MSSEPQSTHKIRVGIIGAGGWAKYGHIPALLTVEAFEVTAVSSRRQETADQLATDLGIAHAFGDYRELIDHPEVDLVVIPTPGPEHAHLAKLAIAAGKDVYTEWPLTTTTAESQELLDLAQAKGVRHVVGLQRRFAPSIRYVHDLIADGYIGTVRGVTMSVGVDAFGPEMPERAAWTFDAANFTDVLSIYGGHFADVLFHVVGRPTALAAVTQTQFSHVSVTETGEQVPLTTPHEVMVIGTLPGGGLLSIQLEGGQQHRTGLNLLITGTTGVLRVTNPRGFENKDDNNVEAMTGGTETFTPLPVPQDYQYLGKADLDASVQDVAYLYATYARDVAEGTSQVTDFADAVAMHHFIDEVTTSSESFYDQSRDSAHS